MWCDGAADPRPAAAEARQPPGLVQVPAEELRQAPPGRSGLLQSLREVRRMLCLLELETNFREDQWLVGILFQEGVRAAQRGGRPGAGAADYGEGSQGRGVDPQQVQEAVISDDSVDRQCT